MTPLEVFKKLPRINCGKCSAGTCMAFAVQLLRRMLPLSECTELDAQSKEEIEAGLKAPADWKERRLQELAHEISSMNLSAIAEGIGAQVTEDGLKLQYMGRVISVTGAGFSEDLTVWDKLLILMYIKNAGSKPLAGKWDAFRDLKDGLIRSESFREACEMVLAGKFGRDPEGIVKRMYEMGAIEAEGFTAGHSLVVYPLPRTPFLVLLWPADEEFGAECKILFDATVTDYIDVEALLYLGIAFVQALSSR